MNPEAVLRDAIKAADDAFYVVSMRDGVTRQEVEESRRVRLEASEIAHNAYRDRFKH